MRSESATAAPRDGGRSATGDRGIYYLRLPGELVFQEFSYKQYSRVPTPGLEIGAGVSDWISAAPDDRWILLTVTVRSEDHLVLVRNFR